VANLQITVQDDTFSSAPYAPGSLVTVQNSLSTTLISPGTVTSHGFLIGGSTLTTADISLAGLTFSGSVANAVSGSVAPLGSTFTLGNFSDVSFVNGSGSANFTVTTLAPVPAPPAIVALLSALPFLGAGAWLRRRNRKANPASC
jgi:hypothetical protein